MGYWTKPVMCACKPRHHSVLISFLALLALVSVTTCTTYIRNEQDLLGALTDGNESDALLAQDVTFTMKYWITVKSVILDRNFTVRGPNVSLANTTRMLDLAYVTGKVTLQPNVTLVIENLVLSGAQVQASES